MVDLGIDTDLADRLSKDNCEKSGVIVSNFYHQCSAISVNTVVEQAGDFVCRQFFSLVAYVFTPFFKFTPLFNYTVVSKLSSPELSRLKNLRLYLR